MRKIKEYLDEMSTFAAPHVRSAIARAADTANALQSGCRRNKKKLKKRMKRKMKMRKIQQTVEGAVGLVLIAAVLLALTAAVAEGICRARQNTKYIRL